MGFSSGESLLADSWKRECGRKTVEDRGGGGEKREPKKRQINTQK